MVLDNRQLSYLTCKIFACGSFYIGWAGPNGTDGVIDFRPKLLLHETCAAGGNAETTMAKFQDILRTRYTQFLVDMKRLHPEQYRDGVQSREFFGDLVMIGLENGVPFIRGIDLAPPFDESAGANLRVSSYSQTSKLGRGEIDSRIAGVRDEFNEFCKTPEVRNSLWRLGLIEAARFLVTYEMVLRPDVVGPPVDIVQLTKDRATWIQRKPECDEEKEERMSTPKPKPTKRTPNRPRQRG